MIEQAEKILLEVSAQVKEVDLGYRDYHAKNLVRCIIDWPCKLIWNDGFRIVKGDYEEWEGFREEILKPNTKQIKQLFKTANKRYRRYLEQKEILGG